MSWISNGILPWCFFFRTHFGPISTGWTVMKFCIDNNGPQMTNRTDFGV